MMQMAQHAITISWITMQKTDLHNALEALRLEISLLESEDQETKEKAFSLFFSSKGAEGTGLGLFIAHKIVKAHGGVIIIDSSPNQGSRFRIFLPNATEATG